jgi:hypothetical protein
LFSFTDTNYNINLCLLSTRTEKEFVPQYAQVDAEYAGKLLENLANLQVPLAPPALWTSSTFT